MTLSICTLFRPWRLVEGGRQLVFFYQHPNYKEKTPSNVSETNRFSPAYHTKGYLRYPSTFEYCQCRFWETFSASSFGMLHINKDFCHLGLRWSFQVSRNASHGPRVYATHIWHLNPLQPFFELCPLKTILHDDGGGAILHDDDGGASGCVNVSQLPPILDLDVLILGPNYRRK